MQKLGLLPDVKDDRTLMMARYFTGDMPTIPPAYIYEPTLKNGWGMLLNDKRNDCTIAAPIHLEMVWGAYKGIDVWPTDAQIISDYSAVSKYDPKTGENDNGARMLDVMKRWKNVGICGHKLDAFGAILPGEIDHVKAGIFLFGGLCGGLNLPTNARGQKMWSLSAAWSPIPRSWGGHEVLFIGYDADGLTCVTWGGLQKMSWAWFKVYIQHLFAGLSQEFMINGHGANGFDFESLNNDLYKL